MTVLNQQTAKISFRKIFFKHTWNTQVFPRKLRTPTTNFLSEVFTLLLKMGASTNEPREWNAWLFLVHCATKSPTWDHCCHEEGSVHQGHSSKQLAQLWSETSQSPFSFVSKFQLQRRTVNPSIKGKSWTVMIHTNQESATKAPYVTNRINAKHW